MATLSPNGSSALPELQSKVDGIVEHDAARGAPVHKFDPDASPQEKASSAGKARDQLKSVKAGGGETNAPNGKELVIDTGHASIVPTITIEDVDKLAVEEPEKPAQAPLPQPPGALPVGPAPEIPDWYKLGWRAVGGIDEPEVSEGEVKDKTVLDKFLSEQYYGAWYHNAAVIVVVVTVTHFLTRFHFGLGWLLIVMAFCGTYYNASVTRFRRYARDDIQRELVKTRLMSEHETADWLNQFMNRFWLIYEPVLSQTIVATVDQILSANCPPFLESLRLSAFTLGTKAPRIDKVRTFPATEQDIVMMDWGVSFTPNDIEDITPRQLKSKVNPKIVLSVRLGKGLATAGMPVLLEDISFSGLLRVRMKLMSNFPHVQIVDLSFLEKPVIDYVLKPIGGETFGFDIGNIPGLSAFLRDTVHGILGPMMYDPNHFTLNLEQMLSGTPLDSAIGVLQVTIQSARGLKGVAGFGGGTPDPYVSLSINNRAELARTKYKHNTNNPTWMETKFLLVNSLTEMLVLSVYDYNEHRSNTLAGAAGFDLSRLNEDATQEGIEAQVLKDGKEKGILRFDVSFYPVLKPGADSSGVEQIPDTKVGIVRLTLHQAKDLDASKSMSGELNPFARVQLGSSTQPIHKTPKVKHTNNPVWESATEFLCSDKASSVVTVKVIDDREFLKDPIVGFMSVRLEDLLSVESKADGRDWWPLNGCKSGKLRVSAEWKPLNMAGSLHGADQYVPPIGVVRLWLQKATDVKNVEAALGGKSDPYVRVQINNITQGRTEVVNNNLNPEWDQIIYIPVHSLKETMMLECMDYQNLTKDRSLGYVELKVSDLAQASEGEFLHVSTGKKAVADPIRLEKGTYKGSLHYEAEFVPVIPIKGVQFSTGPNEMERAVKRRSTDGGAVADSGSSISDMDEEGQNGVVGITASAPLSNGKVSPSDSGSIGGRSPTTSVPNSPSRATSEEKHPEASGQEEPVQEQRPEETGKEMSKDELLKHQSGIMIFNVLSGQLHKKARLEVLLDEGYWPAFTTVRARSTHAMWQHVGEGFMKELDFGRVWLRLNEAPEGEKDDVIAEWKGDAKSFLTQALDGPTQFTLLDKDDEERKSVVEIEARYVPVPVKLEPRESINNQGTLRVTLIEGREIPAVDRGGKSDPFAVFTLNGQKVYKSQTKKKTVNPDWDESFIVQVPSRVGAKFSVEVFDWNQIEQAKELGSARIELADLEPFVGVERVLNLSSDKLGDKGQIRLALMFQPEMIAKTRKNTSTFSSAGRAMTQIGHLPVGAGKGVIQGVTGVFKRKNTAGSDDDEERTPVAPAPPAHAGQASHPVGDTGATLTAESMAFPSANGGAGGATSEPGTLRVTVLDAKDLTMGDAKPYVMVRVGDKEHKTKHTHKTETPEWNEAFNFVAGPAQPKLFAWVYDHKTLGKDKLLGSAEVDIWRHLQHGQASSADVFTELREGQGLLRLRLEFDTSIPRSLPNRRSVSSMSEHSRNQGSPSRFSLSRRRGADRDD